MKYLSLPLRLGLHLLSLVVPFSLAFASDTTYNEHLMLKAFMALPLEKRRDPNIFNHYFPHNTIAQPITQDMKQQRERDRQLMQEYNRLDPKLRRDPAIINRYFPHNTMYQK